MIAPAALVLFGLLILTLVLMVAKLVHFASGLQLIVDLTKNLAWPISVLLLIAFFYEPIFKFLDNLGEVKLKVGDKEARLIARQTQEKVVGLVAAATAMTAGKQVFRASNLGLVDAPVEPAPQVVTRPPVDIVDSIANVSHIVNERSLPKFARGSVLWVDDRPANNAYLIAAFRELGMRVDTALSTEEAMRYVQSGPAYDVIITDMGRPPDARAGYTLLAELHSHDVHVPVIVYAGSNSEEHRKAARAAGAIDSTNDPQRVFDLVTGTITRPREVAPASSSGVR